jgi:hypothetical protein
MFSWFQKYRNKQQRIDIDETPASHTASEPESVVGSEDNEPAVNQKQFWNSGSSVNDWIGEIYNEQLKKGAFDNLPGKGKPVDIHEGDVTNSILKNANVLPQWLTLQHEIRNQLQQLIFASGKDAESTISQKLNDINKKVMKYNNMVPSAILQKRQITRENMEQQLQLWL